QRARCPIRGALEALSINILPNALKQVAVRVRNSIEVSLWQPIALAREALFNIELGMTALNHRLCGSSLTHSYCAMSSEVETSPRRHQPFIPREFLDFARYDTID